MATAVACSGSPAAGTDAAATGGSDAPDFTFGDAPSVDAAAVEDADAVDTRADTGDGAVADDAQVEDALSDAAEPDVAPADDADTFTEDVAEDTVAADTGPDAGCAVNGCASVSAPCATAVCMPDGTCSVTAASDGKACNDSNACTMKDSCQNGTCTGSAINCDDGNGCTIDSCKAAAGCIHAFDIAPCEDGDGCTLNDQCVSGVCTAGAPVVCTPTDPCQEVGNCEPATGICPFGALPNGTACGSSEVCMFGKCSDADPLPIGTLAWFNSATCPSGWADDASAVGRTVVPGDESSVGTTDGDALAPGEDRVHSHTLGGSISTSSVSYVGIASCCNGGLSSAGQWSFGGNALPASSGIPYVTLRACKKTTAIVYGDPPGGLVAFIDGATCPASWSAALAGLHRYIVGTPAGGTTGAMWGGSWGASHTHSFAGTFSLPSHGIALASGCCGGGYASAGDVGFQGTSDASSASFPSLQRVACTTSSSGASQGPVPAGMVAYFTTSSCPSGWSVAKAVAGRLVVGALDAKQVGAQVGSALSDKEDRGHSHSALVTVTPPSKNIAGANGGNGQGADSGVTEANATTGSSASGLPFVQWLACQKD